MIQDIAVIISQLAAVTAHLTAVTAKLEEHYSRSLNGLEATVPESEHVEKDSVFGPPQDPQETAQQKEDVGLVKNLDILPPVEVREESVDDDDSILDFANAEGISIEEAMKWLKEQRCRPEWLLESGLTTKKKIIIAYAKEWSNRKNKNKNKCW